MQSILAFDTTAEFLSVAVFHGGLLYSSYLEIGLTHGEVLPQEVDRLLSKAGITPKDLTGIVCSRGPGSFTGLRIGMSFAKGFQGAVGTPMASVSLLEVYGWIYGFFPGVVLPVIDGRKQRYYAQAFSRGMACSPAWDKEPAELVSAIQSLVREPAGDNPGRVLLTGPHADRFITNQDLPEGWVLDSAPRPNIAAGMIHLGLERFARGETDAPDFGPEYLRESQAVEDNSRGYPSF